MNNDLENLWNAKKEFLEEIEDSEGEKLFKNNKNVLDEKGVCSKCRGRGYYVKDNKTFTCDLCHGNTMKKEEEIVELSEEAINEILDKLGIPEYYRNREFDPDRIKKDEVLPLEVRKDTLMDFYIRNLKKIHDVFILDKKLDNSYLVMAPQGNAKAHLVYCSMVEAVKRGKKVAPYFDTNEIYEMFYNNDDRLKLLLEADVCFIKMLTAFLSKKDTQAVKYILDKRARRGLPTVVTSRFNMAYLKDIEPHLENNFGLKNVESRDYSKLKEVLGVYPKGYSNSNKYNNNFGNNNGGNYNSGNNKY